MCLYLAVTKVHHLEKTAEVYNANGLRDSVKNKVTGLIARQNTPEGLVIAIIDMLKGQAEYARLRENVWKWSKEITFEKSYKEFAEIINQ